MFKRIAPFAVLALLSTPALAASSAWTESEGGRVRLITGTPSADGTVRAALEIDLLDGWKTYWMDPGAAGVPPSLESDPASGYAAGPLSFPVPRHFDDGYAKWAGYDAPVVFPVTFTKAGGGDLKARAFLGICQSICIPVQAVFEISADSIEADPGAEAAKVEAAFAALPGAPRADLSATVVTLADKVLTVATSIPDGDTPAELFLAGSAGFQFGQPVRVETEGGGVTYTAPVLVTPRKPPVGAVRVPYVLSTPDAAVTGLLELPDAAAD